MIAAADMIAPLAAIGAAMMLGIMSPGPSFVLVARMGAASGRSAGLAAALGMGIGGAIFALLAVLGLHIVLSTMPRVYAGLQVAGACYLLYLAYLMWAHAKAPLHIAPGGSPNGGQGRAAPGLASAFATGLATQLGNPKTAIVYGSVFASVMPATTSWTFGAAVIALLFALEFGWYAIVALFFSSEVMQRRYASSKAVFDRLAACAMGALGGKILDDLAGRLQRGAT